jgi:hypothetical protein
MTDLTGRRVLSIREMRFLLPEGFEGTFIEAFRAISDYLESPASDPVGRDRLGPPFWTDIKHLDWESRARISFGQFMGQIEEGRRLHGHMHIYEVTPEGEPTGIFDPVTGEVIDKA